MYYPTTLQSISIFHQVNQFVLDIVDNQFVVDIPSIANQLNIITPSFWQIYDSYYQYAEAIRAFASCTFLASDNQYPRTAYWDNYNTVEFLELLKGWAFLIQAYQQRQFDQELHNRNTMYDYLSCLTQHYSKLLFIRVDLFYVEELRGCVTLELFDEHWTRLLQHISNKQTCFANLQGYAWAIEQGLDKSLHGHLLLIYDGQKVQHDTSIGQAVGEKWVKITQGFGVYWNCNSEDYKSGYRSEFVGQDIDLSISDDPDIPIDPALKRDTLGIGMIYRANPQQVANAINVGLYLVKPEKTNQYCCIKLPNARTFGHGQYDVTWRRSIYQ